MQLIWLGLTLCFVTFLVGLLFLIGNPLPPSEPYPDDQNSLADVLQRHDQSLSSGESRPLRLSLVSERDLFAKHHRYRVFGQYMGARIGCDVQLMTVISYQTVLSDLKNGRVDAAFFGSMAALAIDRLAKVLLTMHEYEEGVRVLSEFGAVRFIPCAESEYRPVYGLIGQIGSDWSLTGIPGAAPRSAPFRK